ncbi:unnamed protein product [Psylliodes chrysocephalus]|uniref:Beta-glucosidase n=1 Tax=Psylliodes chrysocephalus TaxID=3402493 RepID=A0A9P0CNJ5_9CUCU|nr:unnamed protein product [Psylliodes chrysocephala]
MSIQIKQIQKMSVVKCFCKIVCMTSLFILSAEASSIEKYKFPDEFLFGVASSAYQIEGGYNADGKGESIYDYFTKKNPKNFFNNSNGNIACDFYHKWRSDVKLLKDLGVNFYRFSISWTRILPNGFSNKINGDGLRYYNDLINNLIENDIQPMVTMYQKDLPMSLQRLGGWTNPYMAYYYEDYARILFSYFGDRVKHWITLDMDYSGYGDNVYPPFLNEPGIANYLCQHVMLLAHAKVYHLYDAEFRIMQKGKIGIAVNATWFEPGSFSPEDIAAAERAREFKIGSIMNPIFHTDGNYPNVVRQRVDNASKAEGYLQSRLPYLLPQEADFVQGTYDFVGLNIYTTFLVKENKVNSNKTSIMKDANVTFYQDKEWSKTSSDWLRKYLKAILESIHEDKVNIKGYAVWSFLDSFQWVAGYREKFGLYHVDFTDPNRKRTPKKSASWYKKVIKEKRVVDLKEIASDLKGDS